MMTKDLGSVHARDIVHPSQLSSSLEEGTMDVDNESENVNATVGSSGGPGGANDHSRNLEELRVQPGDWLLVAIYLPVKAMGMSIAGAAGASSSPTISSPTPLSARGGSFARGGPPGAPLRGDAGWGRGRGGAGVPEPAFGGHWRGRGAGPVPSSMGRGREREVDRDVKPRRPSPTGRDRDRRPSPTGRDRDRRRSGSRDRSRTRSRSPPPRRRSRTSSRSRSRSPPRRKRD
ncbi:hypothetical protein FRB94_003350 [Tulasnella sp. JGI-2019a]|nr:hypothetical protein FRB94_003350 [Tulasnella sp. JGI-2019a]